MKKSIILATAAGVGLSLSIIAAQAGPHGQAGTNAVPPTTPGLSTQPPSTVSPGHVMQQDFLDPTTRGAAKGASGLTPGLNAPGRK
jgi:hypothetical protein